MSRTRVKAVAVSASGVANTRSLAREAPLRRSRRMHLPETGWRSGIVAALLGSAPTDVVAASSSEGEIGYDSEATGTTSVSCW